MIVTWVLLLAVGVVSADVGLGYHYRVPQTSYGVPSYQNKLSSGQFSTAYTGNSGYEGTLGYQGTNGYQSTGYQGAGYQTGNLNAASGLGSNYYQTSSSSNGGSYVEPTYQYTANTGLGTGFQTQYESSSQYQASALNKYQQYYQVQQQPAQVFKHFYVHAAPEEPESVKPRAPIVLPPAQKHYKIIFVKAPSVSSGPRVIAPVQAQNEEKTIVYVLVKKPEDQQEVVLPKIEQKPPSKPEVYFIKYKNKEDSQAVINNIVKDYNHGESISLANAGGTSETSYQSDLNNVQYQSPVSSVQYQTPVSSVQYQTPVINEASTGSFGSQSFGLSSASAISGADHLSSNIASSISSPVTVSTTASSIGYEGASAISTSQGVPHETYGPPKFRVN